jgi:hypothetical protein
LIKGEINQKLIDRFKLEITKKRIANDKYHATNDKSNSNIS